MVWFVIALVAVVVCGFVVRRGLRARERRRRLGEETAAVRALLSEDLTWLREDLGRLDREVAGLMLDEASRDDRDVAHESFEAAERGLPGSRTVADVGKVAAALADATYRMAGVRARVAGEEPPQRRVPCFFDPRHGLSVDDVMWTERVHGTRTVPVCARDAALVGERQSPHTRTVQVGSRTLPYWDAGAPSEAYYRGWFGSSVPFLPGGPPSRTRGVDWQAVQLGEAEAARYFSPTAPGFGGGVGGNGGVGGGGS